ncbi:MAG: AMP-binding protein [Clostridia bacterium]
MQKFIEKNIGMFLHDVSDRYKSTECLVMPEFNLRLTYKEFDDVVTKVAKAFLGIGVKKGDHIAMWATNKPQWVICFFATARIGAVLVTVNTNYKIFELEYLLRQSDATTLFLIDGFKDSNYIEIINELIPNLADTKPGEINIKKLPFLKNLIYLGDTTNDGMFSWDEFVQKGNDISDDEVTEIENNLSMHEVVNIQYTSGTTGFPKGVMLTHYNILNNGLNIGNSMNLSEKDRLLIHVPLFHCFGCVLGVMSCITHATTMVIADNFNPLNSMQLIESEKCTAVHGVPTMFIFMLEHKDFKNFDFSSLRTGIMAGSPCPIKVMRQVVDLMNMKEITIAYGQTEASPVITQTTVKDDIEIRVSTVGSVLPGITARIADPETNETLPPNTQGEICCKGYNVMKGYYNMAEATKNVIDANGWLHTGDIGVVDENGYYKITGRIKDMIIRGGENIYPREIEELLYTNDKISDVQIIGVPSKELGEEIGAFVIPKVKNSMTEEEVKDFVRTHMARYKTPKYVVFVEEFPMNAAGKIQKFKLREQAVEVFQLADAQNIETA